LLYDTEIITTKKNPKGKNLKAKKQIWGEESKLEERQILFRDADEVKSF